MIRRAIRRFGEADRGSVAIEFGMLLLPFILGTLAVLQLGAGHMAQASLEAGMQRLLEDQRKNAFVSLPTAGSVRAELCAKVQLIDCNGAEISMAPVGAALVSGAINAGNGGDVLVLTVNARSPGFALGLETATRVSAMTVFRRP